MPIHHDDLEMRSGDTWTIPFTLIDEGGTPLNLTDAVLSWVFLDPDGNKVTTISNAADVVALEPLTDGKGRITVPATATAREPGRYMDAMRVQISAEVDTVFFGSILVSADPFAQIPEEFV